MGNASTITGHVGVAAYGDISLQGGTGSLTFTQIGHGGYEDPALNLTLSGDISVVSQAGSLDLLAGTGSEAGALVGHGSLRSSAANVPLGSRAGDVYVEVGSWNIVPNGTTALSRIGHISRAANNGVTAPDSFSLIGTGGDGTTSHVIDATLWALIGAANHIQAGGDATFGGVNLTMNQAIVTNGAGKLNLLATQDLTVLQSVQNMGSGAVSAVAGWDGATGMSPSVLDFLDHVPLRSFDITPVLATPAAWGNHSGRAIIGGGTQTTGVAFGSKNGASTVLGHAVEVRGSDSSSTAFALVGALPVSGSAPTGSITLRGGEGGVAISGGSHLNSFAQVGHRILGSTALNVSGSVEVTSGGGLSLTGGSNLQTFAHIGHGGTQSTVASLSGDLVVRVAGDLAMEGGQGASSYAQIGHGGGKANGAFSGNIAVDLGGSLSVVSTAPSSQLAYAKIGHGDDWRGASASQAGTGDRSGDIVVTAGSDISLASGMIGHVNGASPANSAAGRTWIAVASGDPTNPAAGTLSADASSEFAGAGEVRIYLPQRGNNEVAAGALINGVAYDGGVDDPSPAQRADEFTNHLTTPGGTTQPGEHDSTLGSGPAPTVAGNYAFYYDSIVVDSSLPPVQPPVGPGNPGGPGGPGTPGNPGGPIDPVDPIDPTFPGIPVPEEPEPFDLLGLMLDDERLKSDWVREQGEQYSDGSYLFFGIFYEGFSQYGLGGESIFEHRGATGGGEGAAQSP